MSIFKNKEDTLIILDANFILLPSQFKIDYFNEINSLLEGKKKFIIFRQIFDELEAKRKRESKGVKFQKQLDFGLMFIDKMNDNYNIIIKEQIKNMKETSDQFILRKSIELKKNGYLIFIATNDSELRKKARIAKLNLIFLRQYKYLTIERSY